MLEEQTMPEIMLGKKGFITDNQYYWIKEFFKHVSFEDRQKLVKKDVEILVMTSKEASTYMGQLRKKQKKIWDRSTS